MQFRPAVLALGISALLAGCAAYGPRALPAGPDLHASLPALTADLSAMRLEPLKPIFVDAADGLTPSELAVLAVLNDPGLAAKRAARGVAAAQLFAAALMPDPQISVSLDHPSSGPDRLTAYSLAPSLDLVGLMARSGAREAAKASDRQADLDLLWAEWGVAQQARQLAETTLAARARQATLNRLVQATADRAGRSGGAFDRGDATLQTRTADVAAKIEAEAALAAAAADEAKARSALNSLLNLDPSIRIPLAADTDGAYDARAVAAALAGLPGRRPDLLALRAGFDAQDANVRAVVLAQFPLNQIGLAFARDPGGTVTEGLSAVFALPIFNGSRGAIAIQSATREQLAAEYQARLDQAAAEVGAAQGDLARAEARAAQLGTDLPLAEFGLGRAQAAYDRGDLDSQAYLALLQTALSKRADLEDARLQARLAEIQIETLLFLPPVASQPTARPSRSEP